VGMNRASLPRLLQSGFQASDGLGFLLRGGQCRQEDRCQASAMTQEFRDKRPPLPDPLLQRRRGNPITSHVAEFSCRPTSNNGDDNEQFEQRKSLSPRLSVRARVSGSVFALRLHFFASIILSAAESSSKVGAFHRRTAPSAALARRLPLGEKATTETGPSCP
jgi:hypothetical protein